MITRSKLVEQLRVYQIRSQHKCSVLTVFSPKPFLSTWADVMVAILWASLFSALVMSSYVTLFSDTTGLLLSSCALVFFFQYV